MSDDSVQLVLDQMAEVQEKHEAMELVRSPSGLLIARGELGFKMEYNDRQIEDTYEVAIALPRNYPRKAPKAVETGNRIPDTFHRFWENRELCLGAPGTGAVGLCPAWHTSGFRGWPRDPLSVHAQLLEQVWGVSMGRFGPRRTGDSRPLQATVWPRHPAHTCAP